MTTRDVLTLVPVFEAILGEGSLSRAATRLGVTQSAVSQALGRLRRLTGDELFERTGQGVRPTPRALEMANDIHAALNHLSSAFSVKMLDISTLDRTFVLDIGAGFDALVLPPLVEHIAKQAPGVKLVVSNARAGELLNELKYGETELAFDFRSNEGPGLRSQLLGRGSAIGLARKGHPALRNGLTKDLYLRLPHAALVWTRSPAMSGVKQEQLRQGIEPKIAVSVPTIMTLGAVVASSDLIATASSGVGKLLSQHYRLQMHPLPFRFAPLALYQLWHARFDGDAGHRWLRTTMRVLADRQIKALAS